MHRDDEDDIGDIDLGDVDLGDADLGDADLGDAGAVRVFAPGSVGNVGCGLDVFGLALRDVGDVVRVTASARSGVEIGAVRVRPEAGLPVTADRIPSDPVRNSAGIAARSLLAELAPERGVRLEIEKGLPLSSGFGGSAASAVGAVVATAAVLGLDASPATLLRHAAVGERDGSGSDAGDNVAASLLGGWVLVRSTEPFDVVRLPVPAELRVALVHPAAEVRTADARRALGASLPLPTAVKQWANVAAVVAALHSGDMELLGRAMQDHVAEPARAPLVPGFADVRRAALEAGALGASLSGSGPTVFALCTDDATARGVASAMADAFERAGAGPAHPLVSLPALGGARAGPSSGDGGR